MQRFSISHCRKYVPTPRQFLSYARWDAARLEELGRSRAPITIILGGGERRAADDWFRRLQDRGIAIRTIANADHLFGIAYALDLSNAVIQVTGSADHG